MNKSFILSTDNIYTDNIYLTKEKVSIKICDSKDAKKAAAVLAAAAGIAAELILGLPVYIVLGAVALISLPAALISRAKRRAEAVQIQKSAR